MTSAELEEQIHWEAENHIPFDIKEVSVDYEVLRRRPEAGQMDLLLVAAKRDEIDDYVQIARQAKLKPLVVDIDAFTIQNLFEYNRGLPQDETFAIINVVRRRLLSTSSHVAPVRLPATSPVAAATSPSRSSSAWEFLSMKPKTLNAVPADRTLRRGYRRWCFR